MRIRVQPQSSRRVSVLASTATHGYPPLRNGITGFWHGFVQGARQTAPTSWRKQCKASRNRVAQPPEGAQQLAGDFAGAPLRLSAPFAVFTRPAAGHMLYTPVPTATVPSSTVRHCARLRRSVKQHFFTTTFCGLPACRFCRTLLIAKLVDIVFASSG
jgi:hypothetical protein